MTVQASPQLRGDKWDGLTAACQQAMQAAAEKPGRYGGRYVGRYYDKKNQADVFLVLDDDDPDEAKPTSGGKRVPKGFDVLAHAMPSKVWPIGYARNYLGDDGSVIFADERREQASQGKAVSR